MVNGFTNQTHDKYMFLVDWMPIIPCSMVESKCVAGRDNTRGIVGQQK